MQLGRLLTDDDAVSPVIGVILMVAITVILAAVIASFVLGLGGNQQTTPAASFTFDYTQNDKDSTPNDVDGSDNYLQITHDGGDTIKGSEIFFRGSNFADDADGYDTSGTDSLNDVSGVSNGLDAVGNTWADSDGSMSADRGDESAVAAGDSVSFVADTDYEIRVVWQPGAGDQSATLGQDTGPDA